MKPNINNEFKDLIPPLEKDEFDRLEKSIKEEGCREPLTLWNGTIIDGHNRYNVCSKNNIKFNTVEKKFKDKDAVVLWMINNQLGRRNISSYDRTRLALRQEDILSKDAKENQKLSLGKGVKGCQKSDNLKSGQTALAGTTKPKDTKREIAKIAKVSHDTVAKVKYIEKKADEATKKKLSSQDLTINKVYKDLKKQEKREEIVKNAKEVILPKKKYNIIYADPPWSFKHYSDKGKGKCPENYYNCMNMQDIKDLPIQDLADENCILFMWVTYPILHKSFEVIKEWGFEYKTVGFTWVKRNRKSEGWFWGMGYWTRSNAELCIIATKGSITRQSASVHQIVDTPLQEHSKKPDVVAERIVELVGDLPRIELFARIKRKGWDSWGNEVSDK